MPTAVKKKKQISQPMVVEKPKKLSKMGEWRLKNPNGIITIVDMKAVMK
ncbi:MAG: hypothetical protein LBU62_02030 [Bacteroidales bacterium]|nr:hypothetical protein [Bacteroidales bacterium]